MSPELLYQLHLSCLGLPKMEAKQRRASFAGLHGVKEDTVYKRLKKLRGDTTPKPPRVTPELKRAVEIVWGYKTTPDGALSTELAQQIARAEGALVQDHPISSLNQAARRLGLNPGAGYARRMEAAFANQAHRVDVSGSRHFRVVGREGGDWVLEVCRAEQRNKRWRDGELLWILALIDDYSRVMHARYAVAPGEAAELVQHFCVETWRSGLPRGLPEHYLISDQGAFGKDGSTRALLDFLGIELVLGQPENKRRNGRVERPFRPIKEAFERSFLATHRPGLRLRLSSLQQELGTFIARRNERRHPIRRDRGMREDWERSLAGRELRECPEDALHLAAFRRSRTVTGEGWLWHEKRPLEIVALPPGLQGRRVTLVYNRQGELVVEHDGTRYNLRPPASVPLGSYRGRKAPPATAIAVAAAARPRSAVGLFSARGQARLRESGTEPVASGQPVQPAEAMPKLIVPEASPRPPGQQGDPFAALQVYRSLPEARRRIDEIVGVPLHTRPEFDPARLGKLEQGLLKAGLSRRATERLAYQLKQAIGL